MKLIVPIIYDKNGPIKRAIVRLNTGVNTWATNITEEDGTCQLFVEESLTDTQFECYACGYKDFGIHINLGTDGNKQIRVGLPADPNRPQDIILPALEKNNSTIIRPVPSLPFGNYDKVLPWQPPDIRDFLRADAWAVNIPGLPFVPRGSSEHPERLLTYFLHKYPGDLWDDCFKAYKERGYTHWILSWPDARNDGWNIDQFKGLCIDVKNEGFYVHVKLVSKDFDARDNGVFQWKNLLSPVFDTLSGTVDEYGVWEWDSFNVPGNITINTFKWMGQYAHSQGASFWAHFFPGHTAWFADGSNRFEFWQTLSKDVDGLDYQTDPSWDVPTMQARLVDTLSQFGEEGNIHKLRLFEDQASLQFTHDHPNEYDGALRGYLGCCTIDNVKHTDAKVWGYGNGGMLLNGEPL